MHFVEQVSKACVGLKENPLSNGSGAHGKEDYYEVLGLDRNATSDDIKRAFRSLARKFHPDKNPDDPDSESKFKEVQEAYAILSNPDEKSKYDRYGHNRPGGIHLVPMDSKELTSTSRIYLRRFREYFGSIFGSRRSQGLREGSDLLYRHSISFEEAFSGLDADIDIEVMSVCESCDGSGALTPDD